MGGPLSEFKVNARNDHTCRRLRPFSITKALYVYNFEETAIAGALVAKSRNREGILRAAAPPHNVTCLPRGDASSFAKLTIHPADHDN